MSNTRDVAFIPEVLQDTLRANFRGRTALLGSAAVITSGGLAPSAQGGDTIEIPKFDLIGDLEDVAENVDLSVGTIPDGSRESCTVVRSGKAFTLTDWKKTAEQFADPYAEYTRQILEATNRRWDRALIEKACASGLPSNHVIDRFNAGSPVKLSWSFAVDGRRPWGDEQDDIGMIVVHSKGYFDLIAEVDSQQRPIQQNSPQDGEIMRVGGVTVKISDRTPIFFPVTTLTATGTTPPTVTLTDAAAGNTLAIDSIRVEITTGGARGTAVFRYSYDGGANWAESGVLTAATYTLKQNGMSTGIVLNFPVGTYATDNVYVTVNPKYSTVITKRKSLLLWYSSLPLVEMIREPKAARSLVVLNTYFAAHRFGRLIANTRPGVTILRHN
jgi:hypothetical protein